MNGSRSKMTRFLALTVIIAASVGVLALMRMGDQEREAQMVAREPSSTVREVQERQDVTRESQDQTDEPAVSEGTTESGRVAFRQPEERRDVPGYEVAPSGRGGRGGTDVDDAATPVDSAEVVKIREQFEPRLQELEASCTRRAQPRRPAAGPARPSSSSATKPGGPTHQATPAKEHPWPQSRP